METMEEDTTPPEVEDTVDNMVEEDTEEEGTGEEDTEGEDTEGTMMEEEGDKIL